MTHYHNIPTTKINDYSKCIADAHTRFSCWVRHRRLHDADMAPDSLALVRADVPAVPRPGWAPDPLMVGIRSPDGLVVGSCTSHPEVLGSIETVCCLLVLNSVTSEPQWIRHP